MNIYSNSRILFPSLAFALCSLAALASSAQQNNPLEMLQLYPADPSMVRADDIERAKTMLAWRIERGEKTIERMEREIDKLKDQIAEQEARASALAEEGMGVYALTTDTFRAQLIGRVLERLLEVRVDIAAGEALVSHLEKNLNVAEAKVDEGLNAKFKIQRDVLKAKLETLHDERERMTELYKRQLISEAELRQSKLEIQSLEAELALLEVEKESVNRQEAAQAAAPLTDARVNLLESRARETMAEKQLREIASAAAFAPKLSQVQREIDRLRSILDIRVERLQETQLDIEESRVFLELIKQKRESYQDQPNEG